MYRIAKKVWRADKQRLLARTLAACGVARRFRFRISGRSVVVPLVDGQGWQVVGEREVWFDRLLAAILRSGDGAVLDVGANLGQTLLKVKCLDPDRQYVGFEPNPVCVACLYRLIDANGFAHCDVIPVGLAGTEGLTAIYIDSPADSSASMVAGFRDKHRTQRKRLIPTSCGDRVLAWLPISAIALVKIDVEGAELDAVRGLTQTLKRYQPPIICEILPVYDGTTPTGSFREQRQAELLRILSEDYDMYRIGGDGALLKLEEIECHSDLALTNYLFWPTSRTRPPELALHDGRG